MNKLVNSFSNSLAYAYMHRVHMDCSGILVRILGKEVNTWVRFIDVFKSEEELGGDF